MGLLEIAMLTLSFFLLLALGVPIAWSLGISSFCTLLISMDSLAAAGTIGQQFVSSLNSFTLLAIPFFILAGQIMNQGGIAKRLIELAKNMVGALPGGLAHINVVAAMLFGAIAGSSVAAVSAIGSILGPKMEEEGYSREFGASINITSSSMGLVIPPSNVLIVYSLASGGTSIGALFLAGYLPGILTGLALMGAAAVWASRHAFPVAERVRLRPLLTSLLHALPSLLMLVLVIGGIVAGIFTATEAAAIAVVYALILGFIYREIRVSELPELLMSAVKTTSIVMILIAASISMSWVLSYGQLPQSMSAALLGLSDHPVIILLVINLLLLVVGMFMDMTPAVLIFTPIFLPVAVELGIDPVHFGIIMVMNLCIGICTPPVGTLLFVGISVAGTSIEKVIRPMIPLFLTMLAVLLLVTFWPDISLLLPRLFGFL